MMPSSRLQASVMWLSLHLVAAQAQLCTDAAAVLSRNWVGGSTVPAPGLYPHQWSWDTAFIAIGHAATNATRARIELESLFDGQWTNGLLPHIVFNPNVPEGSYFPGPAYWRSSRDSGGLAPSTPETSGIVNPPVHAAAVLTLLRRDPSDATLAFAGRVVPKLAAYLDYLFRERDPDGNGLVYVRHPWENGMDNSPVWDSVLDAMPPVAHCHNTSLPLGGLPRGCMIPPYERADLHPGVDPRDRPSNVTYDRFVALLTCARNNSYNEGRIAAPVDEGGCAFLVEDVFFNVLVAQAADDMASILMELERHDALNGLQPSSATPGSWAAADKWASLAKRTRAAIDAALWSTPLGMYASRDQRTGELLLARTIGGLSPLMLNTSAFAPDASSSLRRELLLHTLRSPGFALPHAVPTLDAYSARFSPRLYWRGPTWYNTDWLLLRGLASDATTIGDAARLRTTMYQLINTTMGESADGMSNATVSDGPFREYWDPWTGEAHGTGGFSWTAALFFDTFCAPPITPPLLVTSKPVAAAVPEVPHETLSDAESPSIALPLAGVAGAVLAWGSFTLPMKSKAVLDAHLDPLIFQLYMCVGIVLSSFVLLFVPGVAWQWTWWAAASAALWVPGSICSVLAVHHLGIALAQGVWSGSIALVSFLWGQLFSQMREPTLGYTGIALLVGGIALLGLVSGAAVKPHKPASHLPPEVTLSTISPSVNTPVESDGVSTKPDPALLAADNTPKRSRLRGLLFALSVGVLNGTVLVPLRLAPAHPYRDGLHALDFAVCFGPAAMVVMLICVTMHVARTRTMPPLRLQTCLLPGMVSGVLWSIGNACSILASLPPFGLTVGYPATQCCLFIGGLWGIFLFRELRGAKVIAAFFAAACIVIVGAGLLGVYGAAAPPPSGAPARPWWQTGIVYQVYPRSFCDSDGDGIGDLVGITSKLPYLASLGIDIVWLSPIYPSPMADFGYDIANYTGVAPEYGTMDDFDALLDVAHSLGLRVLLDFVPNHSSEHHPWFEESRSSINSPKRDWYVWADTADAPPNNWQSVFGGSAWELDNTTRQYYYHAFLKEQPDLNYRNPAVVEAMQGVLSFWLTRGVDGFRVDAVPFLYESTDISRDEPPAVDWTAFGAHQLTQNVPPIHSLCATLMATVRSHGADNFFLGEVYAPLADIIAYYGSPSEPQFSMPFNFGLLMDAADYVPSRIASAIEMYQAAVPSWGWSNYVLSNHDNPRIATKVGRSRAALANLMLLTLRGTPTIYYGQELGMTDVQIPLNATRDPWARQMGLSYGRDPERTPMQWTCEANAGFCPAVNCTPWLPVAPNFCTAGVNVQAELTEAGSTLRVLMATIAARRRSHALLDGSQRLLLSNNATGLLAFTREAIGSPTAVVVLNWGTEATTADLAQGFAGSGYATLSTIDGEYAPRRVVQMAAVSIAPGEGLLLFSELVD